MQTLLPTGMLSFRIISGHCKGRRIQAPKKLPVRPTTDRAKESLFNILSNQIEIDGAKLLDLFAGTGNISYEFTSRNVASSLAVDADRNCTYFIRATAEKLELPVTVVKSKVERFLSNQGVPHDLVFMDPPYDYDEETYLGLIELLFDNKWIESGLLVAEHPAQLKLDKHPYWQETRVYGSSCFSFLSKK